MNSLITTTTTIEATTKNSIEPIPKFFSDKTINILDEDSIINILSLLEFKDLVQCRRINKRFLQVINDSLLVYKSFFKNYCFSPKNFLSLPQNVLLDTKQKLNNKNMLLDQDYLNIYQDSSYC